MYITVKMYPCSGGMEYSIDIFSLPLDKQVKIQLDMNRQYRAPRRILFRIIDKKFKEKSTYL